MYLLHLLTCKFGDSSSSSSSSSSLEEANSSFVVDQSEHIADFQDGLILDNLHCELFVRVVVIRMSKILISSSASYLELLLSMTDGIILTNLYVKRDDIDFRFVNLFLRTQYQAS